MAFDAFISNIEEIFENLKAYAKSNVRYYKLLALKRIVNAASITFKVLLCLVLILLALFFFSIAAAVLIGRWLDSFVWGFVIVGGFYLVLAILAITCGVLIIRRPMLKMLASKMFRKKEDK